MAEQEMNSVDSEKARHWLASILLRRGDTVMPRFARLYTSLAARPRGWRRRFQRKLAVTTTGAALLLALAGLGAGSAARRAWPSCSLACRIDAYSAPPPSTSSPSSTAK